MYWPITFVKMGTALSLVGFMLLSGCSPTPVKPPPVNDSTVISEPSETNTATYHTVERGETLFAIATRYGRDYKDVARWNNIQAPFALNPGQRLRIDGPSEDSTTPSVSVDPYPVEPPSSKPEFMPIPDSSNTEPSSPKGTHTVQKGDTLFNVARKYGQNFREVAKWNNLKQPYGLRIGQVLKVSPPSGGEISSPVSEPVIIPSSSNPQGSPSPASSKRDFHVVLKGDTLYKIAKHYGRSVAEIAAWNRLKAPNYGIGLGQRLRVSPPDGGSVPPAVAPSSPPSPSSDLFKDSGNSDYHIVAAKDTLYGISRRYKQSVANLKKWNNLKSNSLSLGQKLRVTPPVTNMRMPGLSPDGRDFHSVGLRIPSNYHIVKPGESLRSIANKYGISSSNLAKWNGIGSPYSVFPGQKIKIKRP